MRSKTRIVALALVLAALAVVPAGTDLRADSPGSATITTLTASAGETAQTDTVGAIARGTVETDRAALVTLYHGNGGPDWIRRDNWVTTQPLNDWYGVTTNSDGRVIELGLGGNNLTDSLPASLGNLDQLQKLYLWDNRLSGRIPDLSGLTNLTVLYLSGNQFSQSIPASLGDLTSLTELHLHSNLLSGSIPAALGDLTNLTILSLYSNGLSGSIPAELGNLTNLSTLYLSSNLLSGSIPAELGDLTYLTELYLNNNVLSGSIPTELGDLTDLTALELSTNLLSGEIPDSLGYLTSLTTLSLYSNGLTGPIPAELGNLTSLTKLWLTNNRLTGPIPAEFGNLTNLTELYLNINQLDGPIPDELGNLTSLTKLELFANQLTGSIPDSLGDLTTLEFTRFAYNLLTGCVPLGLRYLILADEVDGLPAQDFIEYDWNGDGDTYDAGDVPGLELPFCMVSGLTFSAVTIAPAFANSTAAYTASVATTVTSTTVTATLPHSGDRASISKRGTSYTNGASVPLAVGPNEITITVTTRDGAPAQTYSVTVFREGEDQATLMLLYNSVDGGAWTDNSNWGSTTVPVNQWFGVVADSNGAVTKLELPGNNLSGALPDDLGSLTGLTVLDLSGNRLTGTIPELTALTGLQTLDLGDNLLSGEIPEWLGEQTPEGAPKLPLRELSLRGNQFRGMIPRSLGDVYLLEVLYLDRNQLSGPITAAFGNLLRLKAVRFAGNTDADGNPSLIGCVSHGLRILIANRVAYESLPAHDFVAVDANGDGDTDDPGDTPGLNLPFCMMRDLTYSDATPEPDFASDTIDATDLAASAEHRVEATTVMASLYMPLRDTASIMKDAVTYANNASVPIDVGPNIITIKITPQGRTPSRTYTVTLTRAPNTPPVFGGGPVATRGVDENTIAGVAIGAAVAATDADDHPLTYSLDEISAESFDIDMDTGQLRTKAGLDFEGKSTYTVTVSVSDGTDADGKPDDMSDTTITVTISVADVNEYPVFPSSETGMRSVDENTAAGENIGDPVAATDDDNDTLTYSLGSGGDADSFGIDAASGQLQTKADLDFEDGPRDYIVTVAATDPSNESASVDVTITVDDVDEAGTVTLSSVQPIVGIGLTASVSDADTITSTIDWLWERSSNQTNWVIVSSLPQQPPRSNYPPLDEDVGAYLRATASYTDEFGSGKRARAVSVNRVQAAPEGPNIPPQFQLNVSGERNVDENTPAGMDIGAPVAATDRDRDRLTYSLDADGAESFDINKDTGQLQTKVALDFETTAHYFVGVTATDTAGDSDLISVDITVNNVEEPGTVTLSSLQPLVGIPLTATLDDPDNVTDGSVTWSWERSPNGTSDWISIGRTDTYTPTTGDIGHYLQATASYNDAEGPDKSAQTISVTAVELGPGRNAPVFREHPTATRSIPRNTPAGRDIGEPFTADDADNDALIYSLGGLDEEFFDLDASSGQLRTREVLTGIHKTEYTVLVSVSDGKDEQGMPEADPLFDATTVVTITVAIPRTSSGGGGGGGGFGAGPGEVQLVIAAAVAGEEAPAGQRFGFEFHCTPPDDAAGITWTFSLGAGQASGRFVPGKIPCSLTVTDAGGADAVDGLFTDRVLGEEALRLVVTFTYGIVTTAVPLDAETVVEEAGRVTHDPRGIPRRPLLGAPGDG